MKPTIFLLLGFPGTGKYTTAVELVRLLSEQGNTAKLLDNHRVSNVLFDLIAEADGSTPLPPGIFPKIREMNMTVINTISELSPKNWSFVFTHYLTDNPTNQKYIEAIRHLADRRNNAFIPFLLSAETDELLRRIPSKSRREMQKLVDSDMARVVVESGDLLIPNDAIHIDVTNLPPTETAASIIRHAHEVRIYHA